MNSQLLSDIYRDPEIGAVMHRLGMFELPNKPKLTDKKLQSTAKGLARQYTFA